MSEGRLISTRARDVGLTIRLKQGEAVIGEFSVPKYGIGEKVLAEGRAGTIVGIPHLDFQPPEPLPALVRTYRVKLATGEEREVPETRITTVYGPEERARQREAALSDAAGPKTRHKAILGPREGRGK